MVMITDVRDATFLNTFALAEDAIPLSFSEREIVEVPVGPSRTGVSEVALLRRILIGQGFQLPNIPHADYFLLNLAQLHDRLTVPPQDKSPETQAKAIAGWQEGNIAVVRRLSSAFNWFFVHRPGFTLGIKIGAATAIAESALSLPPKPFVGPSSRKDADAREFLKFLLGGEASQSLEDISSLWEEAEEFMRDGHFYTAALTFFAWAGQAQDPEEKSKGLYGAAFAFTNGLLAEGAKPTEDQTWGAFHLWQLAIDASHNDSQRDVLEKEARMARGGLTLEFQMIESAKRRLEEAARFNNVEANPDSARESFDEAIDILASAGVVILPD